MSVTPAPSSVQPPQPPTGAPAAPPNSAGAAPVTQPVPNRGNEAMAAQSAALIVKLMGEAIGVAGGASELGLALADCIRKLAKYVPQAHGNPAANLDSLKQLYAKSVQQQNMPPQPKPPGA